MSSRKSFGKNKTNPSGSITRLLKPIHSRLIFAALLASMGTMLSLVPLAGIVDAVKIAVNSHDTSLVTLLGNEMESVVIISVTCMFVGMVLILGGELVSHLADNQITYQLRVAIARRLAQVPLGWFTDRAAGEVKQAMQDDVATLHSLTAHFYTAVGRALGAIIVSVIYLFVSDWRLASITTLPFLGFLLFLRHATNASKANVEEFVSGLGRINNAAVEFVSGIPVVKAFGVSGRAYAGYRKAVDSFADAFIRFTRPLVGAMAHAHAMIAPITVLGVVLLGGTLFTALGWVAALDVLPFVLVAPSICAPLLLLHTLLHDLGSATGASQRVLDLLETPVLEPGKPSQQQLPTGIEIRFDNVSYGYKADHQVIKNISFTLRPGTVTAIVGRSGAGKSTLARLLLRFFDPHEGRITLGGVDLRDIEISELYQRVGFVLQEVRLVHASIRDNIALGRPSASLEEIERAARVANIHERIISLPRGYDSVVGEDAELSGGEQQQVSIARAVLLDPPVLVLDEATASADASNEVAIQEALSRFTQGRTLVVIAHRLDTVMHADRILLMEDGAIVEQGTHHQLLDQDGHYARLWKLGGYQTLDVQE
ncbi:MAG: ABC transporter ATP-binding protein [Idiomarina loihiensis]